MAGVDPAVETRHTYDANAQRFAEAWWANRLTRQMDGLRARLPAGRVADLGCGAGRDVEWLGEHGYDVVGVDLSAGMLAEGRRRLPSASFVGGDLCRLPLASASVDGVWSCSCLVHLDRSRGELALGEIARVLRPGGVLYLGLEEGDEPEWRVEPDGARRRYWFWQPDGLVTSLEAVGLEVGEQFVEHVGPWRFITTFAIRTS